MHRSFVLFYSSFPNEFHSIISCTSCEKYQHTIVYSGYISIMKRLNGERVHQGMVFMFHQMPAGLMEG